MTSPAENNSCNSDVIHPAALPSENFETSLLTKFEIAMDVPTAVLLNNLEPNVHNKVRLNVSLKKNGNYSTAMEINNTHVSAQYIRELELQRQQDEEARHVLLQQQFQREQEELYRNRILQPIQSLQHHHQQHQPPPYHQQHQQHMQREVFLQQNMSHNPHWGHLLPMNYDQQMCQMHTTQYSNRIGEMMNKFLSLQQQIQELKNSVLQIQHPQLAATPVPQPNESALTLETKSEFCTASPVHMSELPCTSVHSTLPSEEFTAQVNVCDARETNNHSQNVESNTTAELAVENAVANTVENAVANTVENAVANTVGRSNIETSVRDDNHIINNNSNNDPNDADNADDSTQLVICADEPMVVDEHTSSDTEPVTKASTSTGVTEEVYSSAVGFPAISPFTSFTPENLFKSVYLPVTPINDDLINASEAARHSFVLPYTDIVIPTIPATITAIGYTSAACAATTNTATASSTSICAAPTSDGTTLITITTATVPTTAEALVTSSEVSQTTSSKAAECTSSKISQITSSKAAECTSSKVSQTTSSKAAECTSSKVSQTTSSKAAECTSSKVSQTTSSKAAECTSTTAAPSILSLALTSPAAAPVAVSTSCPVSLIASSVITVANTIPCVASTSCEAMGSLISTTAIETVIENAIERAKEKAKERAIEKATEKARGVAIEKAIEKAKGLAIEKTKDKAKEKTKKTKERADAKAMALYEIKNIENRVAISSETSSLYLHLTKKRPHPSSAEKHGSSKRRHKSGDDDQTNSMAMFMKNHPLYRRQKFDDDSRSVMPIFDDLMRKCSVCRNTTSDIMFFEDSTLIENWSGYEKCIYSLKHLPTITPNWQPKPFDTDEVCQVYSDLTGENLPPRNIFQAHDNQITRVTMMGVTIVLDRDCGEKTPAPATSPPFEDPNVCTSVCLPKSKIIFPSKRHVGSVSNSKAKGDMYYAFFSLDNDFYINIDIAAMKRMGDEYPHQVRVVPCPEIEKHGSVTIKVRQSVGNKRSYLLLPKDYFMFIRPASPCLFMLSQLILRTNFKIFNVVSSTLLIKEDYEQTNKWHRIPCDSEEPLQFPTTSN